jgi:hypothetical protein
MTNPHPVAGWKPGQSGNPDGRTKEHALTAEEVRQRCLDLALEAVGVLATIMRGGEGVNPSIAHLQASCAEKILDRGVGKAAQSIVAQISLEKHILSMNEEELIEFGRRYSSLPAPVVIDVEPEIDGDLPESKPLED